MFSLKTNEVLKTLRQTKKLTQSETAKALDVSLSSYQKYEREKGSVMPSLEVLVRMADFYGVSTDYLLGRPLAEPALDDESRQLINALQAAPAEKKSAVVSLLLTLLS